MEKNLENLENLDILLRNCRLYYKLGVVPQSAEVLDPTPLAIPFGCEKPLTRREMFKEFGYGTFSNNTALYDDDDDIEYSEFPEHSDFVVDEEQDLTLEEANAIEEAKKQSRADELIQKYGMEDKPVSEVKPETTEVTEVTEGDSGSTVPAS